MLFLKGHISFVQAEECAITHYAVVSKDVHVGSYLRESEESVNISCLLNLTYRFYYLNFRIQKGLFFTFTAMQLKTQFSPIIQLLNNALETNEQHV